jgi:2-polyprenyl-3-methyl-5-hydroxy-6-metoxy-1,4-benzoquinol methylase
MSQHNEYLVSLETRLAEKSDRLEEIHLEAAIDAQLTVTSPSDDNVISSPGVTVNNMFPDKISAYLFNDYVNPNAVSNCLSPYVPTSSEKISAFVSLASLSASDILLDIGCGDGRVCVAAAKLISCRAIGLDISPPCIERAKELAVEEGVDNLCRFYQADATTDPDQLLGGM